MDFYKRAKEIDKLLEGAVTKAKFDKIAELLQESKYYQDYFFKKANDIAWFEFLKAAGYFSPDKAPGTRLADQEGYFIPLWNVLLYLEKISQQVDKPGHEKYIDELLTIIKEVSIYKTKAAHDIDNFRTWHYFVKILLNLPTEMINKEIFDFIPIWLDSKYGISLPGADIATKLLPRFLTDKATANDIQKAEIIIDHITAYKKVPITEERAKLTGKKEEAKLVIDSFWLKEVFKKYSDVIGQRCSNIIIDDLEDKIRRLLRKKEDGTYTSLYDEPEYSIHDPLEMLIFITKRIMLVKAKTDVKTSKKLLSKFLHDTYLIFPKLAIYIIGQNVDNYKGLFWKVLDTDTGRIIMENTLYLGDELKHLLNNLTKLSNVQRKKLNEKIKQAAEHLTVKDKIIEHTAYLKQIIYQALYHDEYFKMLYEEMKAITKTDAALHPAVGKAEIGMELSSSPLTKDDILGMPNDEIADFLSTFKTEDSWKGPSVSGLAEILGQAARGNPEKFIDNIWPYRDSGFIYIYNIIDGIKGAWNEKKALDWVVILDFAGQYVNRQEFWDDKFIVKEGVWREGADHKWVAGIVAELIQDGTRNDAWAFSEEHFEKAKEILFLLLDKLEFEKEKEIADYVTYTLNTSIGRTVIAFILLALRIARIDDKKGMLKEVKWASEYRDKYEEILNKKIVEGFTCLGRFVPNLYYLDKEWVRVKIESLNKDKGSKHWEAFMDGYLSIGRVYDELYALMRPHYQYGIKHDFKEKRDNEQLVQHIALGYLRGNESFSDTDSLFRKILDNFQYEQIEEIISFLTVQKGYIQAQADKREEIRKRFTDFWRWLFGKLHEMEKLQEDDERILSALAQLTDVLPKIDKENSEWLMLSASHVHKGYNSHYLIEYLYEIKGRGDNKQTAKYICEIYLKMLEQHIPDYDEKHIRSIVEFLYNNGAEDCAREICNIYGQNGYEFLRDIYETYN